MLSAWVDQELGCFPCSSKVRKREISIHSYSIKWSSPSSIRANALSSQSKWTGELPPAPKHARVVLSGWEWSTRKSLTTMKLDSGISPSTTPGMKDCHEDHSTVAPSSQYISSWWQSNAYIMETLRVDFDWIKWEYSMSVVLLDIVRKKSVRSLTSVGSWFIWYNGVDKRHGMIKMS